MGDSLKDQINQLGVDIKEEGLVYFPGPHSTAVQLVKFFIECLHVSNLESEDIMDILDSLGYWNVEELQREPQRFQCKFQIYKQPCGKEIVFLALLVRSNVVHHGYQTFAETVAFSCEVDGGIIVY